MSIDRILLVDDEHDIRLVAGMSLRKLGSWEVRTAASGAEALEMLATFPADLVLLDVMMPGQDGPETLRLMRGRGAKMPVIFLTAKVQRPEIDRLTKLGARGVIAKPFDPLKLATQVRDMVGETA